MISLVDDFTEEGYYHRAWCCTEALIMETLERSYQAHFRFEHVLTDVHVSPIEGRVVKPRQLSGGLLPSQQKLSVEKDRPKIEWLEQQTKLLDPTRFRDRTRSLDRT